MKACSVEGCGEPYRCSGYCGFHYGRWRLYGDPRPELPRQSKRRLPECVIDDCTAPVRCKDLCNIHYDRMRRYGKPDLPERIRQTCAVETCDDWVYSNGHCRPHDQRVRTTGSANPDVPLRRLPTADQRDDIQSRILARSVRAESGCLEWQGHLNPGGYGGISWRGRQTATHIAMWVAENGPLPDGDWTLDHLCYNRKCSEVTHLELVSRAENTMRAMLRKYAGTENLPEPVLDFLRAASKGLLEGREFFEPWIKAS